MRLELDPSGTHNYIQSYDKSCISIADSKYCRSLIVSANQIITPWAPNNIAELQLSHWEACYALQVEFILLGTGNKQHFPDIALTYPVLERGIGLEIMDTAAACRTYNIIVGDGRKVAAALILA